jgi:MFS family permease
MRETFELLRNERRARVFFLALAQSALGTGAGYVALLLLAYDRFESPWAISFVLIADLVPAMLLGPLFGAIADRWSRKWSMVVGDVLRLVAFAGVALVDGYMATLLFALMAGIGTAAFTPAALAALPSVVDDSRRVPATNVLYGVVADLGFTLGPALAAGLLAFSNPETLMIINAVTFAFSAVILVPLRFGASPERSPKLRGSLGFDIREGLREAVRIRAIRIMLLGSGAGLFCAGLFNVAELFYAKDDLETTEAGFAVLVTAFGAGFIVGSLQGSRGGTVPRLKRRYLWGLFAVGASLIATGASPVLPVALVTFALAGFGNGLLLVYERMLIHATVPDALVGRIFGVKDALTAWAFAFAFLAGGALVSELGARELILLAGAIAFMVFAVSALALRNEWNDEAAAVEGWYDGESVLDGGADVARADGALGQHGSDVVSR